MKSHLHFALQSAQWASGSILDAEFYAVHMDRENYLTPVRQARERLMDALDRLSSYEAELNGEIRESGTRPTGEPGVTSPPAREASGPVGRDSSTHGEQN